MSDFRAVLHLHHVDVELMRLRQAAALVPDTIAQIDARTARAVRAVELARERAQKTTSARRAAEREWDSASTAVHRFEKQLLEVKKTDEYRALQHEIEQTRARMDALETDILRHLEKEDDAARAIAEAQDAVTAARAAEERDVAAAREERARLDAAIDAAERERDRVAATVRRELLVRYEAVLHARPTGAIAPVRGDVCTLCRGPVPPQALTRVKRLDDAVECDGCGRLLALEDAIASATRASAS